MRLFPNANAFLHISKLSAPSASSGAGSCKKRKEGAPTVSERETNTKPKAWATRRGHATRLVVQDHLVLALGHVLIESLEEIYATLRFTTWLGQERIQS